MFTIIKYSIAVALGIYIYNNFVDTKKVENKPKVVKAIPKHQCPIDKGACRICKKKAELNGGEYASNSTGKEVILFPKEGQVLTENQVSIKTPEGKEEFRKQMGWLRDICDEYALKEYQKKHGIKVDE